MRYRVEVDNRAAKQIGALEFGVRHRVMEVLHTLQDDPRRRGCAKLKGRTQPAWRIRVGSYGIVYRIYDDECLVRVYGVLRRDQAYQA